MLLTEEIDFEEVNAIYWKYHSNSLYLPDLSNSIFHTSARDNQGTIAFGMVKLFPEAILVMNKDRSLRDRAIALKLMAREAIIQTKAKNYKYLHATIHDDAYLSLLSKHYGFKLSDGKQVSLEL
jgi:hypothetical protein